jgi:putative transcriptional regulator
MPDVYAPKDPVDGGGRFDRAKFEATTEEDIERQIREDGIDPSTFGPIYVVGGPDVRSLRKRLGMTQEQFADTFDLSLRTVQGWEQRHWSPDGAGRVLISLIAHDPEALVALVQQMREAKIAESSVRADRSQGT